MNRGKVYLIFGVVAVVLVAAGYLIFSGSRAPMEHGNSPAEHEESSMAHESAPESVEQTATGQQDAKEVVVLEEPGYKDGEQWEKINGKVPVKVSANDQVRTIKFYLTDQLVRTVTTAPFNWVLETTQYEDCMYTLRAVAFNAADEKLGEDRSRIWIDNTPDNCM